MNKEEFLDAFDKCVGGIEHAKPCGLVENHKWKCACGCLLTSDRYSREGSSEEYFIAPSTNRNANYSADDNENWCMNQEEENK